jgi:hypothetical protein
MEYVNTSPFQYVLDLVEQMSFEDQATLTELLYHRLTEYRRTEIAHNAAMTLQAIQNREAQQGSIEDFKRDMLSDA